MASLLHPKPARTDPPSLNPRVALYCRVSSEDQADRGTIQAQRDFLRNFATLYSLDVAGLYEDDGFSGTLPLENRPDSRRLLEDAEAGKFGVVLVYKLDRLGRSLPALLEAHTRLESLGVTIRSATEPFDTSTPIGRFVFQLLGSLAELDRSTILERMTMGRDRVARGGKWTGGPVPFGYDLDLAGCLIPSERIVAALGITEAGLVQQLYQRIIAGSTASAEARRLNATGVPAERRYAGGKVAAPTDKWKPTGLWSTSRIVRILRSPLYRGVHRLDSKNGPIERPVPALVTPELWQAAQNRLSQNRTLATR